MASNVTDFLQGMHNCPPGIVPGWCSNCSLKDELRSGFRRNPLKPRCAEPNFMGSAVLQGVNDGGFNHENILMAFYPSRAPAFHCVCGRSDHEAIFAQESKYHFPQLVLRCACGRSKKIILHLDFGKHALGESWISFRLQRNEYDLPPDDRSKMGEGIACRCGSKRVRVYYQRNGYEHFPVEGETVLLQCARKKCGRCKKVHVHGGIDMSEPWLNEETEVKRSEITVRTSTDVCPDERAPGEPEKVFVIPLTRQVA